MTPSIPTMMRAAVVHEDKAGKTLTLQEVPVPVIDHNEILIQVKAVAQNPTDWKHLYGLSGPGVILGCDFSGVVVKLGSGVTGPVKVGDHVAGFVMGGHWSDRGAFAEYVKTPADLVWIVPPGTLSHEEAATMGCGLWTAVQALYHPTRLGLTETPSKATSSEWILVYGGSTSVGQYAIQLAHLSGYKIVTTASPHNFELVKSLGADAVFDYKSPDAVDQIRRVTNNTIHAALDANSTPESQLFCVRSFGSGKGKLLVILGPSEEASKTNPDITVQPTLLYTCLGRAFQYRGGVNYPVSPEDVAHMSQFLPKLPGLVKSGAMRPNRVKLWEGGLGAIKEGLDYMRAGKVTGEKLVYEILLK